MNLDMQPFDTVSSDHAPSAPEPAWTARPDWPGMPQLAPASVRDLFQSHVQALSLGGVTSCVEQGDAESLLWEAPHARVLRRHYALRPAASTPADCPPGTDIHALLDDDGRLVAWWQRMVVTGDAADAHALPYHVANQTILAIRAPAEPRAALARELDLALGVFARESLIDELAGFASLDACAFRRGMLHDDAVARELLDMASRIAAWGSVLPAGRGRGLALDVRPGAELALIVEASPSGPLGVLVHRVVAVARHGASDAEAARASITATVLHGLGPVLARPASVEVRLLEGARATRYSAPGALRALAPAVCNALRAAGGPRLRVLPLMPPVPVSPHAAEPAWAMA